MVRFRTALAIASSSGVFTLGGTNRNTGGVTVSQGTLQLASANAAPQSIVTVNSNSELTFNTGNGSITTFNVAGMAGSGNVVLADSSGAYFTLSVGGNNVSSAFNGQLSGNGGLFKSGNGTLNLGGALSYTGSTTVSGGLLSVNVTDSGSPVAVNAGATLGGSGSVISATVAGGGAIQAGSNGQGGLTIGTLTFNSSSSNPAAIDVANITNYAATPAVDVTGANGLTVSGGSSVTIALSGPAPTGSGTIELLQYAGSIQGLSGSGAFNLSTTGLIGLNDRTAFSFRSAGGYLDLSWSGDYPIWRGNTSGSWDTSTTGNWVRASNGASTTYEPSDAVLFDNTATGTTALSVAASNVSPSLVTFNNTTKSYTVNGPGGIVGGAYLNVTGGGLVTLANSNGYTGATTVSAGTLQVANANAVSNSTVTVNVNNGLAFNTGGGTISGFNVGGLAGNGNLNLADTGGYAANLNVGSNGAATVYSGQLSGPGGLTIVGGNLTLATSNTFTGATNIAGGTLTLGDPNALAGSTLNYNAGGLSFGALSSANVGGLSGSQSIALQFGLALTVGSTNNSTFNTTYSGQLSGNGGLSVAGGNLTLTNTGNSFTGGINITSGTLSTGTAASFGYLNAQTNTINFNNGTLVYNGPSIDASNGSLVAEPPMTFAGNSTIVTSNSSAFLLLVPSSAYTGLNSTLTIAGAGVTAFHGNNSGFSGRFVVAQQATFGMLSWLSRAPLG